MTAKEERVAQYRDLVQKASTDPEFRAALLADPKGVLVAEGWSIPAAMDVRVVENSEEVMYLTLPALGLLSEEQMTAVTGGVSYAPHVSSVSKVSIAPE